MGLFVIGSLSLYANQVEYITEGEFASKLIQSGAKKVAVQTIAGTNAPLTREKAAVLMTQYLGYQSIAKGLENASSFSDVQTSKGEIQLVNELGIMKGVGDGLFSPKAYVTNEAADAIVGQLVNKLNQSITWQHACYAISSSSQKDWMKDYDAISFGWAQIIKSDSGFEVSTSSESLKVPDGFETAVDLAKAGGAETYLMVYFDGQGGKAESLLVNTDQTQALISSIVALSNNVTKNDVSRSFDGITIDFEGLASATLKAPYVKFLNELKTALTAQNKKLNVAVQPTLYYKGYDYQGIGQVADHVILMAHDYGARELTLSEKQAGTVTTPLTPINNVYQALLEAQKAIPDPNKIVLQFSFGSLQWQEQNGVVLNSKAYTPSYDKIQARIAKAETVVNFVPYYQSTYATYEENGINNTIWYEDAKSIQAKMELAKLLGVNQFSYWRLGTIPNEVRGLQ